MNYGDFPIEETIHMLFTTRAFATGIPGTLSAATVAVYEDITATPIETGIAVTESLNSIAGLNAVPIVAIAASGYEVGKNYHVVIEAGTVDSVSVVGEVIGYFSIGRSAAAVDLANGTDGLGAIKAETALIVADTNELQTDDYPTSIAAVQTTVDAIETDTGTTLQAELDAIQVAVITNATGADIATDIVAMKAETVLIVADTNELQGDWVNTGRLDTILDSILADTGELQADDYPTTIAAIQTVVDKIPLSDGTVSWNATALAAIESEVNDALIVLQLDHLLHVADASTTTNNSIIAKMVSKSATAAFSSFVNTTDSLEATRDHIGDGTNLAEAGGDGDHLTAINLPNQTMDIIGNITGNLSGSIGSNIELGPTEVATELATYDGPTNAEMEARTPTAAQLAYITANAATGVPVTFTTSGGSTTAAVLNQVDGAGASATDDQYNGRLLVFNLGTLKEVVTDITDYDGGTLTATITAIPFAPTSSHTARLI